MKIVVRGSYKLTTLIAVVYPVTFDRLLRKRKLTSGGSIFQTYHNRSPSFTSHRFGSTALHQLLITMCYQFARFSLTALVLLSILLNICSAFSPPILSDPRGATRLHLFGNAVKDAFKNDGALGKAENPGLKNVG